MKTMKEENNKIKNQKVVFKEITDFKDEGIQLYGGNSSTFTAKKLKNREGESIEHKNKRFVLKRDPFTDSGSFIEKISYDIFSSLGVKTPKSYIVTHKDATKRHRLATEFLKGYKDLARYIGKDPSKLKTLIEKRELNGKPVIGFAENNAIFFFCGDPDLIGRNKTNIGLIEHDNHYEVVKIDPTVIYKFGSIIKIPDPLEYASALKVLSNFDHADELCKGATLEENLLGFEKVANLSDDELKAIVFNSLFKGDNIDDQCDLHLPPIEGSYESTLQRQIFESLKQRRDIFRKVRKDFIEINSLEGNEKYEKLLTISQEQNVSPVILAFYLDDINLLKVVIQKLPGLCKIQDKEGNNILHLAIAYNRPNVLEMLDEDTITELTQKQNNNQKSPFDLAKDLNNDEFVNKLEPYSTDSVSSQSSNESEEDIIDFDEFLQRFDESYTQDRFLCFFPPFSEFKDKFDRGEMNSMKDVRDHIASREGKNCRSRDVVEEMEREIQEKRNNYSQS